MIYTILGDPIALARARVSRNKVYDAQKQYKLIHGLELLRQHGKKDLYVGPLKIIIAFYMPIPKLPSKKSKYNWSGKPHISKKDLDNMVKYVCDIGNGVLYKDDASIFCAYDIKVYDEIPRTEFTLLTCTEKDAQEALEFIKSQLKQGQQ